MTAEEYARKALRIFDINKEKVPKEHSWMIILFRQALEAPVPLTDDKPEEIGYYWYEFAKGAEPEIVEVIIVMDCLCFKNSRDYLHLRSVKDDTGRFSHRLQVEGEYDDKS